MTISEIAKMAGVSSAAVSRYLNGGSLSAEKKERIKAVIDQTGYVPSESARMLRTKKSSQIGVIAPNISSSTVARIVSGISSQLYSKGYRLLLANTENDMKMELEYLEMFVTNQVDGIIFIASAITKRHLEILKQLRVPIVIVGQKVAEYDCIYHDDFHAAKDMMSVLLDQNCRKLGYIYAMEKDEAVGHERTRGMEAALAEHGRKPEEVQRMEAGFSIESGYETMKRLLKRAPDLDGVFCATDSQAVGAVMCLRDAGMRIPEDVKVCGVGNNQASDLIEPRLTTAHYYYRTSGEEAAKMLISMISGEEQPKRQVMLGYQVLQRGTTGGGM